MQDQERHTAKITMNKEDWEAIQHHKISSPFLGAGDYLANCFRAFISEQQTLPRIENKLDLFIREFCDK